MKQNDLGVWEQWREAILDAIDPIEVVSPWVKNIRTVRGGTVINGECPFEADDKKRRWGMFLDRQGQYTWNCFHCAAIGDNGKGDIFDLIQAKLGLSYVDAMEYLADMYGVKKPNSTNLDGGISEREITDFLTKASIFWHKVLLQNDEALQYLIESRGLTMDTVNRFNIGYCEKMQFPRGNNREMMLATGLFRPSTKPGARKDSIYPVLEDCITIPITRGTKVVNVTSRRLHTKTWMDENGEEHQRPNHLHIREHRVFFNQIATRSDCVYVVESPLDAISYEQAGFPAVATMGAGAFNERVAERFHHDNPVYLSFDSDRAGVVATKRLASYLFDSGRWNVRVVSFQVPEGSDKMDANAYFLRHTGKQFADNDGVVVEDFISWALRSSHCGKEGAREGMRLLDAVQEVEPLVRMIAMANPLARETFLERISEHTGLPIRGLRDFADSFVRGGGAATASTMLGSRI